MEVINIQKYINSSPRKLKLVADMVRKMKPARALETLQFTNKAAAQPLSKAIKTAISNATVKGMKTEDLSFKYLEVNKGIDLKRMRSAGRGRRRLYSKSNSHIRVVLTDVNKTEKPLVSADKKRVLSKRQITKSSTEKETEKDPKPNVKLKKEKETE